MIKIKINKDGNYINYIKITGHANYDDYGKDIVCASVSSIAISNVNLVLKFNSNAVKVRKEEGLIEINVLVKDDTINKVFLNMEDMFEELEKQYSKNIKII